MKTATHDPYADCRLAVDIHEEMLDDATCNAELGLDFWEANRKVGAPAHLVALGLLEAVDILLGFPTYAHVDRAEVKRQMGLPSFFAYVRAKLGAM